MKYFFDDIERRVQLAEVLQSWVGTPWRHRMAVKGKGCDCIQFVVAVMDEVCVLKMSRVIFPDYAPDWHMHDTREQLYDGVKKYIRVEDVGFADPWDGDIMLFHYGKAAAHAAIYSGGRIYQSVMKRGVGKFSLKGSAWWSRRAFNLRVLA